MQQLTGRPERGDRDRTRVPGGLTRTRLSLALLALTLVPAASAVWMATTLADQSEAAVLGQQARAASAGAAEIMVREHGIESRLMAVAADVEVGRLAGDLYGREGHAVARSALAKLRGSDGAIVTGACVTRIADGRHTVLVAGDDATASVMDCATDGLLEQAIKSPAGMTSRALVPTQIGTSRLLVATRLANETGTGAVIATGIDLTELLARTQPAGRSATTLIVDGTRASVLASSAAPADQHPDTRTSIQPRDAAVFVSGILADHPATRDALTAAGWGTSVASLWPTIEGASLALVLFWRTPTEPLPMAMFLGLAGLAAAAFVGAVAFARRLDRPFHDLSEAESRLAVLYHEARDDALHDGLTGMGNHRAFREELARQMELFERDGVPFSLMLVDLDNLKVVNDRDGHAEGDRLITSLATRMREAFRDNDRLFRTGGDEFAVVMPDTELDSSVTVAGRLQHYCTRPPAGEPAVAFSGGISAVPQFTRDVDQLYRQADVALYWAKRHGRGFVEVFDSERDQVPGEPGLVGMDSAIHEVIRLRALTPVFQPIVDLRTGSILGFEGLVRPAAQNPFPDPYRLFAAAASTGRTVELDLAALEVIAAGASAISRDLIVSINLSPSTLEVKEFDSAWLLNTLRRHSIAPERVILELTEREGISDLKRLRRNIMHLSEYGLRLAADDLGAGNSGLRLLSEVPFDVVKIDLSLVQEAARNTATWAVLRSVRDFAWRQQAIVIGEGVETPEQVEALRQLDIDIGQGFLLGKPQALSGMGARSRTSLARSGRDRPEPSSEQPILEGPYRLDGPATPSARPSAAVPILRPLQPRGGLLSTSGAISPAQ